MSSSNIMRLARDAVTLNKERFDLTSSQVMSIRPISDDTGSINIGDGTYDMDMKVFLGSSSEYVLFDVGNSQLTLACPLAVTGATTITGDLTVAGVTTVTDTVLTAEHGAGAIGTLFAPRVSRRTVNGTIITEIKVDIKGFTCKGTDDKDVIALNGTDEGFIGRYVIATCGVVYRIEMICLVLPTKASGTTVETEIDLGADDGILDYDETADDIVCDTGGLAAGAMAVNNAPSLTANDYLYLIENENGADCVYAGGQYLVRLYGHAVMT